MTEFLSKRQRRIDRGHLRFRHVSQKHDTGRTVVATTCRSNLCTRRLFYEAYSAVCFQTRCRARLGRLFASSPLWDGRGGKGDVYWQKGQQDMASLIDRTVKDQEKAQQVKSIVNDTVAELKA